MKPTTIHSVERHNVIDFVMNSGLLCYLTTSPIDVGDFAGVFGSHPCLLCSHASPTHVCRQDVHVQILGIPVSLILSNFLWVFLDVCAMLPLGSFTNMGQFPVFGNRRLSALPADTHVLSDFFRVSGGPAFRRFVLLLWILQIPLLGALTRASPAPG
jgi:hypothetical protein